ncbi:MAG: CinA family protein [Sciscionella sp.]
MSRSDPLLALLGLRTEPVAELLAVLRRRGETVATAESLTAGLLAATLTAVAGSSAVVRGGLVVYATDLKAELAGVPAALLAEHGAVHPLVAVSLATGARERCGASWGIGLTGAAGPDPQDGVLPGTVHLAVTGPDGSHQRELHATGARHAVRAATVVAAVELLAGAVLR